MIIYCTDISNKKDEEVDVEKTCRQHVLKTKSPFENCNVDICMNYYGKKKKVRTNPHSTQE